MATPICPYFGICGGCSLQHIDYSLQLENKKKIVQGAVNSEDVKVVFGKDYHYRNRMDFIFHKNGLGLRKKGKWDAIVDIEKCAISNEKLNALLKEVRDYFKDFDYFDIKKQIGTFKYAVIRTPSNDSSISFVLNEESSRIADAVEKIREFSKKTSAQNVVVTYAPKKTEVSVSSDYFVVKGKDTLEESFLGKTFSYSVQGFFQNNTQMAEKMQEYVNLLLKKYSTRDAQLLDLYGGVGTFGIVNSLLFKDVVIVESIKESIASGNENIEKNGAKNAKAVLLDASAIKKLDLQKPLYVITDPPRSGMHQKTIDELNRLEPELIIYISCNPQQLGKELLKLKNYSVKSAALFDLFPQTSHCEAVVELVKNPKKVQ